jgi:hypothetical protein
MLRFPDPIEQADCRRVGRPTSLTPDVAETIVNAMQAGNYMETEAALAGISVATLRNWLRAGLKGISQQMIGAI